MIRVFIGAVIVVFIFAWVVPQVVFSDDNVRSNIEEVCVREVESGDAYTRDEIGQCVDDLNESGMGVCIAPCMIVFPKGTHEDEYTTDFVSGSMLGVWVTRGER